MAETPQMSEAAEMMAELSRIQARNAMFANASMRFMQQDYLLSLIDPVAARDGWNNVNVNRSATMTFSVGATPQAPSAWRCGYCLSHAPSDRDRCKSCGAPRR